MKRALATAERGDIDGLRLLGLSRIPRCAECPRLHALQRAHGNGGVVHSLPPVSQICVYRACAPMVARFTEQRRT